MLDSFTAGAIVSAAQQGGNNDQLADLVKTMKQNADGGPSSVARDFFAVNKDKKCKILNTSHEGVIYRLNEATAGFYPGSRFPIKIRITNGQSAGSIFEYDLDQIEVIEE